MPGISKNPTQEYLCTSLEQSNKLTSPFTSSKPDSPNQVGKLNLYSDDYSIPSKSPPRSLRSPAGDTSSRRQDSSGKEVARAGQKPTPTPPPPIPTSPTLEYLRTSLEPSTKLASPSASRKLLILDLNPHRNKDVYQNNYSALRPLRQVYPRPYLPSLRDYLFHPTTRTWLDTMVWSSAQPHSVADMVERCFGGRKEALVAVWARDTLGLDEQAYSAFVFFLSFPFSSLQWF